jgi:hypothetical protein
MQPKLIFNRVIELTRKYKVATLVILTLIVYPIIKLSQASPYFLVFLFAIPIILILLKDKQIGFYLIIIWVFFADWFVQIGVVPTQLTWLPEIVLVVYTLSFLLREKFIRRTPFDIPILLFVIIGIISAIFNGRTPVSVLLTFRLDLKFILMFYLLVSFDLPEKFYKTMTNVFLILLVIQIPTALIKYTIYGQGEMAIGTYALYGGTYSTILPLIGISLFLSMFIHKKPRPTYILLIFGFILFSILGGKKGLIYYGPVLVIFILVKLSLARLTRWKLYRIIPVGIIILLMFMPIIYFVPWLKPVKENPMYLRDFILMYDVRYTQTGNPAGRLPTIVETFRDLSSKTSRFLIGYGPGTMIKSYFSKYDERQRLRQTIWEKNLVTELVQKSVEYGYLGLLFYFLLPLFILFRMNEKLYGNIDDDYWKSISFGYSGILFSYFIIGIGYCSIHRGDLAGFIFWFFAAAIYSKGKQEKIL